MGSESYVRYICPLLTIFTGGGSFFFQAEDESEKEKSPLLLWKQKDVS